MLILIDSWVNHDCTIGRLSCGDFRCWTLELPWVNNEPGISCIPAGHYHASKYKSPKHGWVALLHDVPGRSTIEMHPGNYTREINGCILTGRSITYMDNDTIPDVTNSGATLYELMRMLPNDFEVGIRGDGRSLL